MLAGFLYRVEASCARAALPAPARPVPISMNSPPASDAFVSARLTTTVASTRVNFRNIPSPLLLFLIDCRFPTI
ncbi:MAG: hypothetical protein JW395_0849 [Nitrospira sp.]|nr:hypothetical protein [Nitrospira sp.]